MFLPAAVGIRRTPPIFASPQDLSVSTGLCQSLVLTAPAGTAGQLSDFLAVPSCDGFMDQQSFIAGLLLYVVIPVWIVIGTADWLCHRRSRIEETSGLKESALHALLLAQGGIALLLGLLLEINALVLLLMILCLIAHDLTNQWDLNCAAPARYISPIEQHVHNYLGVLPFAALTLVLALHWEQALALVGLGPEPARFTFELRGISPISVYILGLVAAVLLFNVLPYGEEFLRCLRARRRT